MATVYLIGREISDNRTVNIHCHLDKEDKQLLPGMYLKALVETGSLEKPALPEKAIVDYQGNKYIFISEKAQHFEMIPIKIGVTESGFTEVILPANFNKKNYKVVFNGAYDLLAKLKNTAEEE